MSAVAFTACENDDQDFDDYEGGTSVYFSYQYPVRTIMLGDGGEVDNTSDNAHKFTVYATTGGTYESFDFKVQVSVDETLCNNLYYEDGTAVKALPQSYYQLSSSTSTYVGKFLSGVEVQLTDAFFADPASLTTTYVLPLVMTGQTGADRILSGTVADGYTAPARTNSSAWSETPKDYTMVCLKYVNDWEGYYLVKGTATELEKCTIVHVVTTSLTTCTYTNKDGVTMTLTFSGNNCTISDGAEGSGSYVANSGEVWGQKERAALNLQYTAGGTSYNETLVAQRRGDFAGTVVTYSPTYQE